jgi:nicotinate-nucleotide adenylyltransferase
MRRSAPFRFGSIHANPPHAEPGQRIGLLGGSFNPPHAAHRLITEIALTRLRLDRVWWLVTPGNPLKDRSVLLPLAERLALARTLMDDPRVIITDFERGLNSPFTAATLAYLKLRFSSVHFVWLMGGDCLADFHRWQHWRQIFEMLPIAVIDRPGWRLPALASRAGRAFSSRRLPEARATSGDDTATGVDVRDWSNPTPFIDAAKTKSQAAAGRL